MIDNLKTYIDMCEDKPKLKEMFLKIAELKEENQQAALELCLVLCKIK